MSSIVIFLLIISAIFLLSSLLVKKTMIRLWLFAGAFVFMLLICLGLNGWAGKPMYVGNPQYSPFDNGRIFQTYWTSTRGKETLFSVVEISAHEWGGWSIKDTLTEIFYRAELKAKPIPELFVAFDNNFFNITEQQKDEILKIGMSPEQIKKFLWDKIKK